MEDLRTGRKDASCAFSGMQIAPRQPPISTTVLKGEKLIPFAKVSKFHIATRPLST
jgi:hypothetical protein